MSPVSNFHRNAQRIFYGGFDGGLNLSVPIESLPRNELKEAENVEYSPLTGAMKTRGGLVWSGTFNMEIDNAVPFNGRKGFLVRYKGTRTAAYFRWNNIWPVNGELTGAGNLSAVVWDDVLLVASGGKLQKFIDDGYPRLERIESSPDDCRIVFVRDGRVGVVSGNDTLMFSGVGDSEQWENDPADDGSGQYLEIGYKDGMDIDAVMPLSKDLIIFKSPPGEPDKGIIHRLTGSFPDWYVVEVAHNTGTFGMRSVQTVGNDIFYVTPSGVASLSSVTAYGEVKTSWPDRKVSNALTPEIGNTAQMWDVPLKQQLWIHANEEAEKIWVFDYARGIWTTFKFPKKLIHAFGAENELWVFMNKELYQVIDGYPEDNLHDEPPQVIEARMKLGTIITGRQTLIKGAYASFEILPGCSAELVLGKFKMPFRIADRPDYIYGDPNDPNSNYYQIAYDDDDPLFPEGSVLTARRRCIVREWAITPEIEIHGGGCAVSTIGLEIVEV